jgi:hypothetical protein
MSKKNIVKSDGKVRDEEGEEWDKGKVRGDNK